jgi:glutathione S-transferase
VRQRLTELGLDFVARQVPAKPDERHELERVAGTSEIPVLVLEDGYPVCGDDQIMEYLDRFPERRDADEHRVKAQAEVKEFVEL